jgi:CubicO group peptidase (beta-lactamase class C family)
VCTAPSEPKQALPEDVRRAVEEAVRAELGRGPHAGLGVGVLWGGQRLACGYGLRDVARGLPATPRTTWRVASITKSFTAVAVLQLVEEGKLELDERIHEQVPDFPEKRWPVTVRQLLGHLGGVAHYDGPESRHTVRPMGTEEALALFAHKPLVAEPGTRFRYSTWGYNLLGAAIEASSGEAYGEYLGEHLFRPAGMAHAALDERATRDEHHAVGYRVHQGKLLPSRYLDVSSRFAGGGTRASVEDLLGFARAVLGNRLVARETMGRMQASMATKDGRLTQYGMGFATWPQGGHYIVAHAGGQPETSALLLMVPAEGLALVLVANVEGQGPRLRRLANRLVEVLLEEGRVHRRTYVADPVDAVLHEGLMRIFSYGLAYYGWATRAEGTLPMPDNVPAVFGKVNALLDRERIAKEPRLALEQVRGAHEPRAGSLFIHVGAQMAWTLERAGGRERLRGYPARGPLAFFRDYLEVCEARKCPEVLLFTAALREEVRRLEAEEARGGLKALARVRLDAVEAPEALWPELEALASVGVRPDVAEELLAVAAARPGERVRWLERAVALQPRAVEARLALVEARLEEGREEEARAHWEAAVGALEGSAALGPGMLLGRATRASAPPVSRGLLRLAVTLHPHSARLWEALARAERALGDKAAAREALRQAKRAGRHKAEPAPPVREASESSPVPDEAGLTREAGD